MPRPDLAPIDYAALRAQIPMSRVLELLGFRPARAGGPQLRGPCPLPNCPPVRPPRFSVNLQRHIYQCFACGSAGNQLDLWAAAHQLSLPAAAVHLCRVTQIPVPRRLTASATRPSPRSATS
jgi:DNA primase